MTNNYKTYVWTDELGAASIAVYRNGQRVDANHLRVMARNLTSELNYRDRQLNRPDPVLEMNTLPWDESQSEQFQLRDEL